MLTVLVIVALATPQVHAEEPILFRISVENVTSHFQAQFVRRFAETLSARAGAGIKVEFYDGARLFRDADIVAALARGSVEMAVPGLWQFDKAVPDSAILMLPTVYGKPGLEMREAVDGPLGSFLAKRLEGTLPVKVVGRWLDLGHAHIFGAGKGIRSPMEIPGKRIRVAGGRANEERIRVLGGSPVSISSSDLSAYLDRGIVDGILTTYETVATAGFSSHGLVSVYEDKEYYPFFLPLVSATAWERLPEATKATIVGLWAEMLSAGRLASVNAQDQAKATLKKGGMSIVVPSPEESMKTRARLLTEEVMMAKRLGVSDEAMAVLKAAFPEGRR